MISEDRLARQTNVARRGRDDGKEEEPPPDATKLSRAENEVIGIVQREIDKQIKSFRQKLEASGQIDIPSANVAKQAFLGRAADAENGISTQVASSKDGLVHTRLDELRALRQLIAFKRDNELNREARYSGSFWLTLGILLVCVGVETLLNAWFFGEASDRGLAGGAVTAALISGANVALSFVTAWIPLRYTHHRRHWHKLWALPLLLTAFMFITLFNLAVGHYRELLITNPDAQLFRVTEKLLTNPLDIQQIESLVLVIFGFVFSAIALYKGFTWNDPYPGFASADKDYRVARYNFRYAKEAFRDDLKDIADEHSGAIDKQVDAFRKAVTDATAKTRRLTQEEAGLQAALTGLEETCNRVLSIYRAENVAVRGPTPPPAYFSEPYKVRRATEWPELSRLNEKLSEMDTDLGEVEDVARTAKGRIATRLSSEVENIEKMNDEIDSEARQVIDEEAEILPSAKKSDA